MVLKVSIVWFCILLKHQSLLICKGKILGPICNNNNYCSSCIYCEKKIGCWDVLTFYCLQQSRVAGQEGRAPRAQDPLHHQLTQGVRQIFGKEGGQTSSNWALFKQLISYGDFHLLLGQQFQSDFRGPTFPIYWQIRQNFVLQFWLSFNGSPIEFKLLCTIFKYI